MQRSKFLGAALALALVPFGALATTHAPEAEPRMPILEIDVAGQTEGTITIQLRPDLAPGHVERIIDLAMTDAYDGVVFHRVIEGFMAQTGDVQFGVSGADTSRAGMGGSELPDLEAEFTTTPFERGVMGMARARSPNSANSQFFLMFSPAPFLDGQYTVLGEIIDGLDVLDTIKLGLGSNGSVLGEADYMADVRVIVDGHDDDGADDMDAEMEAEMDGDMDGEETTEAASE